MQPSVNARDDVSRARNARDTRKDAMSQPRFKEVVPYATHSPESQRRYRPSADQRQERPGTPRRDRLRGSPARARGPVAARGRRAQRRGPALRAGRPAVRTGQPAL
jgi:hypothetical protein